MLSTQVKRQKTSYKSQLLSIVVNFIPFSLILFDFIYNIPIYDHFSPKIGRYFLFEVHSWSFVQRCLVLEPIWSMSNKSLQNFLSPNGLQSFQAALDLINTRTLAKSGVRLVMDRLSSNASSFHLTKMVCRALQTRGYHILIGPSQPSLRHNNLAFRIQASYSILNTLAQFTNDIRIELHWD